MKPEKVNILGIEYAIAYCNNVSDVDLHKRQSLWGQIDFWTRTIRIYDGNRGDDDILQTIFHEVLHGIAEGLHLPQLSKDENHNELDLIAMALADTLLRNGWMP